MPACFSSSPSPRVYDRATHCNLIFLDIDPEKVSRDGKWVETGKYPAKPFSDNPERLYTALEGLNFAVHLTASSTPEKPRMRIVVDAEKIPLSQYPRAAMAIAALLGLPSVTKESKVAVQPMFLPVLFSDSTEEEHPLIAWSLEGRAFALEDIGEGLFPEFPERFQRSTADPGLDALEFLRAPVPEISLSIAKEALSAIDADCSRDEWLKHAAALKHQFSDREQEAFEVFDEWSQTGNKYGGEKETRHLWNSLRITPIGRMPITIRSILRAAGVNGWDDKQVKQNCFDAIINWMETVGTALELVEHGAKKIVGMPLVSAVQEDLLIDQLKSNAKKRFAHNISASAIRKDIQRLKAEIKAQEKPSEKIREPVWAKGMFYIMATDGFYRHRTQEKIRKEALNAAYSRHLLPSEDSLRDAGIPVTPATLSKPIVLPADYALNHLKIPSVYDYDYDPAQPTEIFFVKKGKRYVNTYIASYPAPDETNAELAGDSLQGHLATLIKESAHQRTLLDFMAFMLQFPGRKVRWAPFVQGAEGAGKTYLAQVLRATLGKEHVRTIGDETIKKGWTEWSFGKQLVVLEEIYASGSSRHAVMNTLKKLITNDDIPVEQRNRDSREEENRTNYLIFSNHHDALALTPHNRRYFVLKSRLQTRQQVLSLGRDYFPQLFDTLAKYPGAFRAFLLNWEISPSFNPDGHPPQTCYEREMVNDSAGDLVAAIRRMMREGDYPLLQFDIVSAKTLLDALHLEEGLHRTTSQQIGQILREEGLIQVGRHLFGTERHYLWAREGMEVEKVYPTALERLRDGKTNLCMDLLWE